jgi:pimeloyl-ACP methyl ester carboxylesterase
MFHRGFADDVATIANTLTPRPILVGHSMGGFVVQKYLKKHTAPAAVLIASVPPRGHLQALLRLIRQHPWRYAKFAITGLPDDLTGGTPAGAREFFCPRASEEIVATTSARLQRESTRAVLVDMAGACLVKPALIDTPMLVLGAQKDALYPEPDVHETARAYKTVAIVVPEMGHSMLLEPGWTTVAEHVMSWLTERGL